MIIFKPLSQESLKQIAKLMLAKLAERLREQSLELVIDEALVTSVVSGGYNRQFGARPMNRYLQEVVEQAVANQLISGEIRAGDKIMFLDGTIKKSV